MLGCVPDRVRHPVLGTYSPHVIGKQWEAGSSHTAAVESARIPTAVNHQVALHAMVRTERGVETLASLESATTMRDFLA